MATRTDLYGVGMQYPFAFDSTTGGAQRASALESVRASLRRLFDTSPGEDFMNPGYGCGLKTLLFETDTDVVRALAETTIRTAVARWEPRIQQVLKVEVTGDDPTQPNALFLRVYFRLLESQTVDNLVYPFSVGA